MTRGWVSWITIKCTGQKCYFYNLVLWLYTEHRVTYPCSNLTLPEPALLSDFVGASELLHVLAEVTLSTVLGPSAGLTFPTHSHWTLHLGKIKQWAVRDSHWRNLHCFTSYTFTYCLQNGSDTTQDFLSSIFQAVCHVTSFQCDVHTSNHLVYTFI